jgi:hypothetical protein
LLTNYIQAGRDYKLEPKPDYVKYTYPHPLRSSISSSQPIPRAASSSPQEPAFNPSSGNFAGANSRSGRWPGKHHGQEKKGWGSLRKKKKESQESSTSEMAGRQENLNEQNR